VFKKIIVGTDFSPVAERACNTAFQLAKDLKSGVVIVHVIARSGDYGDPAALIEQVRPGIERRLKDLCAAAQAKFNISVDWGVVDGHPAEEIATFAERWNGDLIVSGTIGRSGVSRVLLGSVTDKLVRLSKVPVLVVGPENR